VFFAGEDFKVVQKEVSDLIHDRILVGHALKHDLKVLFLDHPRKQIRDTSTYKYFRNAFGGKTPSLKRLSERMLGVKVQASHVAIRVARFFLVQNTKTGKIYPSATNYTKYP
jgi:RNA exonuclease 4